MKGSFRGHSKVKRGILAVCAGSDSVESWGEKGYICAHRRPLKPLCWCFSVLVGDYQGGRSRRPQKAGTETEAEGMTEAQRAEKVSRVAQRGQKSVKK